MERPDRRLNAYRDDLADAALEGRVEARRFAAGEPARIVASVADLRPRPDRDAGIDTQLLFGEPVTVFDRAEGFCWLKSGVDGYVGYAEERALGPAEPSPTHIVTAVRTFLYQEADLKRPARAPVSMGSRLVVVGETEVRGTRYALLEGGGAVIAAHLKPLDAAPEPDYVTVAARFLETPYLWGGRSGFGIDCSGLVQISQMIAGRIAPRDSDMQAEGLGRPIERETRRRGDLVFWKGHVAILEDADTTIHANGHPMTVARESLKDAINRIGPVYGQPTGWRRVLPG